MAIERASFHLSMESPFRKDVALVKYPKLTALLGKVFEKPILTSSGKRLTSTGNISPLADFQEDDYEECIGVDIKFPRLLKPNAAIVDQLVEDLFSEVAIRLLGSKELRKFSELSLELPQDCFEQISKGKLKVTLQLVVPVAGISLEEMQAYVAHNKRG
jgi:hypothetical protein